MKDAAPSTADWISRAQAVLPEGGFGNFDPSIFIARGDGSRVWDADGNEYVDYLIGSGPMVLGHGHPEVVEAVREQAGLGMTFFANNPQAIELAEVIIGAVPCAERLRYVSTGGEADMYAIRAARAYTGRDKIMKCEGGYHGMSAESLMSLAPDRLVNFPQAVPDTAGVPQAVADQMLIAPFNDIDYARSLLDEYGDEIAAVIVEPLQRVVPPAPGYLEALREETAKRGIVLIFDEIVTGFRFAWGGAQELYGVTPDIATLGKVIGGGLPLAAVVGSAEVMSVFDKAAAGDKWLFHHGTLNGNPLASVAGLKTLEILSREGQFETLRAHGERIQAMLTQHLTAAGAPFRIVGDPTLFDVVFTDEDVRDYRGTHRADKAMNGRFNKVLREEGVFKSPGKLYPCLALTEADFELTEAAIAKAAAEL